MKRRSKSKGKLKTKKSRTSKAKIKNAVKVEYDGVKFRSKLEAYMYKLLHDAKLDFEYEKHKFVLVNKFDFGTEKIREVTYLPDFLVYLPDMTIVVETKGYRNDAFPIKLKLFKKHLVENGKADWIYFEPSNQGKCREVLSEILKLENGFYNTVQAKGI